MRINQHPERKFAEKLRKGNRRNQSLVFEKYSSQMLGISRRYDLRLKDAEEVLCNAFDKVFGQIHQYDEEGALGA